MNDIDLVSEEETFQQDKQKKLHLEAYETHIFP